MPPLHPLLACPPLRTAQRALWARMRLARLSAARQGLSAACLLQSAHREGKAERMLTAIAAQPPRGCLAKGLCASQQL